MTAAGSSPSSSAIASRIASRSAAEPRPGADDRQVDAAPGASRPPATAPTTSREELALSMPAGVARVGREQPAEVAQPGGPEQRVAHRVEHDVAVGMAVQPRRAGDLDAAEPQRSPGPNGWLS